MLLYVTGPRVAQETHARTFYSRAAEDWAELASSRLHPRTGQALVPAVTRLELFLAAFSPACSANEAGLPIKLPPPEQWYHWVPGLRRALRDLVLASFPCGPRYGATFDPSGPRTPDPSRERTPPMRTLTPEARVWKDPAQLPTDPRLWLVLSPHLPEELERAFLSTLLRAEPFARVARAPAALADLSGWLAHEVDCLVAGAGLATAGLVADLDGPGGPPGFSDTDDNSRVTQQTQLVDLVSGLQDLYATRETLEPGEAYNRMHSHTGSEELYILLEGEGVLRVNERLLPFRAGQCFGKPCGYGCSTQILNTGPGRMVLLDLGTANPAGVDLCHYPDHGELMARFGGHRWMVPTEAILPATAMFPVYDRRYTRTAASPGPAPLPTRGAGGAASAPAGPGAEVLDTRSGYERWATIYDGEDNPLVALEEPEVDRLLGDVAGLTVADLGCGTGRHSIRLAAAGAAATALDFSAAMMARGREKAEAAGLGAREPSESGVRPGQVVFRRHDLALPLPLPAGTFDRVVCGLVLEHIADLRHLFAEMGRICKPDGKIVVTAMHPSMMLLGITARFTDPETGRETRPHSHRHELGDFVTAALSAGLRLEHLGEHRVDEALARRSPRAGKYLGWPLLVTMGLRPG